MQGNVVSKILKWQNTFLILEKRLCLNDLVTPFTACLKYHEDELCLTT